MKKTLVALAAFASVSSFAQVVISGNIDFATARVGGTQNGVNGTTVSTTTGTSSTSVINIIATEDIGGGTMVTGKYGLDPRTLANDSGAVTVQSSVSAGGTYSSTFTGLARDEAYVGIAGGFGNVRLGSPNSLGLESFLTASPAGTGIGSGYAQATGYQTNSYVNTRYNRSARYDSAAMAGFTVSALYAPGADNLQEPANGNPGTSIAASLIPNARKTTEFNLKYAMGPLTANLTRIQQGAQANGTGWYATGAGAGLNGTSINMFAANYVLGSTTLYGQYNLGQRLADGLNVKGNIFGVKNTQGNVDLIAQYNSEVTTSALNVDTRSTVIGVRADFNLSKTAAIYVGAEKWDTGTAAGVLGTTAGVTGVRNIISTGIRKAF